jgi:hypothetical protein
MRTKSMLARAKKKSKRREGRKMAVVRESGLRIVTPEQVQQRIDRIAGPNASPLQQVLAIQAMAIADREWEESQEYLYD